MLVGPVLIAFGTEEQKQRFLPPARLGTECWRQGYSEAGAGSHLASLQSKAVLDGDHYIAKALFPNYMFHRADTVFGGTAEVKENVIAKQVLGL